ncbi:MAG: membrane protein insertion efficiency factor YidD [Holosporales bacterium]|nr:membrane protein insertion efficiency factor YidD [Holosporales bacterium]
MSGFVAKILVFCIKGYQRLSWNHGHCRYIPTCSEYMIRSIQAYGPIKGVYKGCRRLLRCHPWGRCGVDFPEEGEH